MEIYSGNDDQTVPIMSLGGIGVISVLSNFAPKVMHDMTYAYLNNDTNKAKEMQIKYTGLMNALFCNEFARYGGRPLQITALSVK